MPFNQEMKQVIVIRKDLKMRKGKMVAQGAHASLGIFFNRGEIYSDENGYFLQIPLTEEMKEWYLGRFTKICVSVDSKEELEDIYNKAKEADLPVSLIEDAGLTEFNGVKTLTAVGIGPAKPEDIDKITGELSLL